MTSTSAEPFRRRLVEDPTLDSSQLRVLEGHDRWVVRLVRTELADATNLKANRRMLSRLTELGINVPRTEIVLGDGEAGVGAYLVHERLVGCDLCVALAELDAGAIACTSRTVQVLARYYAEVIRHGGIIQRDVPQFLYGCAPDADENVVYLIDVEPSVSEFDPETAGTANVESITSQMSFLVGIQLMLEGVSGRQPQRRTDLSSLYRALAHRVPPAGPYAERLARAIEAGTTAEVDEVIGPFMVDPTAAPRVAEHHEEILLGAHIRVDDVQAFAALIDEMNRAGVNVPVATYTEHAGRLYARQQRMVSQPLTRALRSQPTRVSRAIDTFVVSAADYLRSKLATGGAYPINVFTKRLVYGHTQNEPVDTVYLGDARPLYARLDPARHESANRFAAFAGELCRIVIDAEEIGKLRLERARAATVRLLAEVAAGHPRLAHKAGTVVQLFERSKWVDIAYWLVPDMP